VVVVLPFLSFIDDMKKRADSLRLNNIIFCTYENLTTYSRVFTQIMGLIDILESIVFDEVQCALTAYSWRGSTDQLISFLQKLSNNFKNKFKVIYLTATMPSYLLHALFQLNNHNPCRRFELLIPVEQRQGMKCKLKMTKERPRDV
jgi:hypothetical protein